MPGAVADVVETRRAKRVYDLARELGVTSEAIVRWLTDAGVPVRSASSVLDFVSEDRVRLAFESHGNTPYIEPIHVVPPFRSPNPLRRPTPETTAQRRAERRRREAVGHRKLLAYIRDRFPMLGFEDGPERVEQEWVRNLFDPDEAIEWMEAGAGYAEADSAAALRREGIGPEIACRDEPCGAGGCHLRHSALARVSRNEVTPEHARAELESRGLLTAPAVDRQSDAPTSPVSHVRSAPAVPVPPAAFSHPDT